MCIGGEHGGVQDWTAVKRGSAPAAKGGARVKGSVYNKLLSFVASVSGSVLAEALIVVPIITIFAAGVLEFGNVLWQRQQVETGVRDAARYWSRCRPDFSNCSIAIARNIAFYGNPAGTGSPRIANWTDAAGLTIAPETPVAAPGADDLVTVAGRLNYSSSPLFGVLLIAPIVISYSHSERYIGW